MAVAPLKVSLKTSDSLDEKGRSAWAAVFARCGLPLSFVYDGNEEVTIREAKGTTASNAVLPFDRIDQRGEGVVEVARPESVADALLRIEQGYARDEHNRPALPHDRDVEWNDYDRKCREFGEACWAAANRLGETPNINERFFCLTMDVDSAGAFAGLGALRYLRRLGRESPETIPGYTTDWLRNRLGLLWDPHGKIRWFGEVLEGLGVPATFFLQTHREHRLDNYDLVGGGFLRKQLAALSENGYHEIGLHSSYATRDRESAFFSDQWNRLRRSLPEKATAVHRAHYLRTPEAVNYHWNGRRPLIDSSLMFGSQSGFRCATAFPFPISKGVVELPPHSMDSTHRYFENLGAEEAFNRQVVLMDRVAQTGGAFVVVIHPHNLDDYLWGGWMETMLDVIDQAKSRGFTFQSLARTARRLHGLERRISWELESSPQ